MADVEQNLADAQKVQESPRGGGETPGKQQPLQTESNTNLDARTVTIDDSRIEEVPPEDGDHTIDIDRAKLRPVEGRAPTPIPSEEDWVLMQKEIQQLAAAGGGRDGEGGREQLQQTTSEPVTSAPAQTNSEPSDIRD